MKDVKTMLSVRFKLKDSGKLEHFLGIDFTQSGECVTMPQEAHVDTFLMRYNMQNCKPRKTLCDQKLNYTENAKKEDGRMY